MISSDIHSNHSISILTVSEFLIIIRRFCFIVLSPFYRIIYKDRGGSKAFPSNLYELLDPYELQAAAHKAEYPYDYQRQLPAQSVI